MSRPALSVVIPTRQGPTPGLLGLCEELGRQAREVGGEVLVLDGSGRRSPPALPPDGPVDWRTVRGRTVASLRAEGLRSAEGAIVAVTEDHCRVAPDWCAAILRAHVEHPDASAVSGAVDNDSRRHGIDWASFYAEHAPELAPLPDGEVTRVSAINVSFRRDALDPLRADPDGDDLASVVEALTGVPRAIVNDDRIRVWHGQSFGPLGTAVMHFHSGRAVQGRAASGLPPTERLARATRAALLPTPRATRRLMTAYRRGQPFRRLASSAPWLLWVLWAQAAGEILGAVTGPGSSPERVH